MPRTKGPSRSSDFKALYGKIERALAQFERIQDSTRLLEIVLQTLVRDFRDDLGFEMGRLYRKDGEDFYLCCTFGGTRPVPLGFKVPRDYPPHRKTLAEGLLIMGKGDPGYDEQFEWAVGVTSTFAAIAVGPNNTHVLAFSVNGDIREEHILYSLSAVRHVINLKLQERKLAGILEEARIIQESLLPTAAPECPGYEIHGESRPAEVVGGDLYDYLSLPGCSLGIAIADAAGHGLPAALVARDVITGLRMGRECAVRVAQTVERLNRIIHRAALSSNFISLFYGEVSQTGTLTYCNAGHHPPILIRDGRLRHLRRGGLVLGPNPHARYVQGRVQMASEDILVLYTDGIVDAENRTGAQFGFGRLDGLMRRVRGMDARSIVGLVFEETERFTRGQRQGDDMTAVVVRKVR